MKIGVRTPNLKKSLKARTTGKVKRSVKRAVIPGYGKKGMGWVKNPKKAAYNKVYNKTTISVEDLVSSTSSKKDYNSYESLHFQQTPVFYNKTIFLCTIFGGWFGLHRYMRRQIGMGLLYTFTIGLFCIGWIVDIIIEAKRPKN